jgi:hypothetical protein
LPSPVRELLPRHHLSGESASRQSGGPGAGPDAIAAA